MFYGINYGNAAIEADDMPNKDATGLTHTPKQSPPLQTGKNIGATEVSAPIIIVKIVFFLS